MTISSVATLAVRKLRPLTINVCLALYLCHRLSHPTGSSLLEILVNVWARLDDYLSQILLIILAPYGDKYICDVEAILLSPLIKIISILAQDVVAIAGVAGLCRFIYCMCNFRSSELKDRCSHQIYEWIRPFVNTRIQKYSDKILIEADSMLGKDPNRTIRVSLPKDGLSNDIILRELTACADKENARCQSGKVSGTLYSVGREHSELMTKVYSLYQWSTPLKPGIWPRINQCEAEVVSMTANLLRGRPIGCVTSGGTESILLAVRAHLIYYGKRRGISCPEIICADSAHCSLNKACNLLNIRLRCIDCDDRHLYELTANRVRSYITCNTIMIFASAPSFPQGTIDPIDDLSALAMQYDIGLHVDACLGGFILPFCDGDIAPRIFDFRLSGVTSMSADTHKYGHATKGTSVIIFKSLELQHASYFPYSRWSGGLYVTPTVAGSRPGALIACAWAALVSIGEAGYKRRARLIVEASRRIADAIRSINGLKLMTPDPTIVVCFGSDEFNIYRLKDALSKMGWSLNPLQLPPALNICVTENIAVDELVRDLRAAVDEVKAEDSMQMVKGTATIYDAARILPSCVVENAMCRFIDASLVP